MAEPSAWGSFSDSKSIRRPVDHSSDPTADYAHRRSYSDVYPHSNSNSYALEPYTAPSVQYRERRSSSWDLGNDPDVKRKGRLASYKVFTLEGKVKSSVKKSFRWVKGKYYHIVYGFNCPGATLRREREAREYHPLLLRVFAWLKEKDRVV